MVFNHKDCGLPLYTISCPNLALRPTPIFKFSNIQIFKLNNE